MDIQLEIYHALSINGACLAPHGLNTLEVNHRKAGELILSLSQLLKKLIFWIGFDSFKSWDIWYDIIYADELARCGSGGLVAALGSIGIGWVF